MRELDRIIPISASQVFLGLAAEAEGSNAGRCAALLQGARAEQREELEADVSLARLLQRQGMVKDAQALLHQTRDLRPDTNAVVKQAMDEFGATLSAGK